VHRARPLTDSARSLLCCSSARQSYAFDEGGSTICFVVVLLLVLVETLVRSSQKAVLRQSTFQDLVLISNLKLAISN
jgi:hypothetical protein